MRVISNTSPVLNLAIIGELSLLKAQFGNVLIPSAVLEEFRVPEKRPGCDAITKAMEEGWLICQKTTHLETAQILERDLHRGESEAIALALELKADWILLDEREARLTAKSLSLQTTGVLGVLRKAFLQGKIVSLEKALDDLQTKARFFLSSQMREAFLMEKRPS